MAEGSQHASLDPVIQKNVQKGNNSNIWDTELDW